MINEKFDNIKVPENLDIFIDEVIDRAYMKKSKDILKKILGGMAASVALFVVVGINKPAIASKIPVIQNVFEEIQDNIRSSGSYSKYATSVNESITNNGVEVTLSEVICDGESLYVSFIIESEKPFRNLGYDIVENQILYEGKGKVNFTNETLDDGGIAGIEGKFIDDNTFIGVEKYNLGFLGRESGETIEVPDNFEFEINMKNLRAIPIIGDDKEELIREGKWDFKVNVDVDKSISKRIAINFKNEDEIEIKELVITPFEIKVLTQHNRKNNYYIKLKDENGGELDRVYQSFEEITSTSNFNRNNFDGDKLIIEIYDYADDNLLFKKDISIK